MKNRAYSTNYSNHKCDLCSEELKSNQFYLFPCSHAFHQLCLTSTAIQTLTPSQLIDMQVIQASLKTSQGRTGDQDRARLQEQDALQQQLDSLIASDCPLCGYAIIKHLSHSLLKDASIEDIESWKLQHQEKEYPIVLTRCCKEVGIHNRSRIRIQFNRNTQNIITRCSVRYF